MCFFCTQPHKKAIIEFVLNELTVQRTAELCDGREVWIVRFNLQQDSCLGFITLALDKVKVIALVEEPKKTT